MSNTVITGPSSRRDYRGFFGSAAAVALAATVVNVVIWVIGQAATDLKIPVTPGDNSAYQDLPVYLVAIATAFAAAMGAVLLALLARVRRGVTIWTAIAVVGALLSLGSPLSLTLETSQKLFLAAMHVAAAAIVIPGYRWAAGRATLGA